MKDSKIMDTFESQIMVSKCQRQTTEWIADQLLMNEQFQGKGHLKYCSG